MIKILKSTYYNGNQYQRGKEYSIDKKTEQRWIKNGIAESAEFKQDETPPTFDLFKPDFDNMTDEETKQEQEEPKKQVRKKTE